jgi:hypothetical protein
MEVLSEIPHLVSPQAEERESRENSTNERMLERCKVSHDLSPELILM